MAYSFVGSVKLEQYHVLTLDLLSLDVHKNRVHLWIPALSPGAPNSVVLGHWCNFARQTVEFRVGDQRSLYPSLKGSCVMSICARFVSAKAVIIFEVINNGSL